MDNKVLIEEMTWPEIETAIQNGRTTVIVDSGSIEQHGPHLPTGTDTILGYAIAEGAARKLGNALVAPVIRPALSEHHMGFCGSFALDWTTYFEVLKDYCESLAVHGFKDIVLISSHGGNSDVLAALAPDIAHASAGTARVHLVDVLGRAMAEEAAYMAKAGIRLGKSGVHAGYVETSMMLAVAPELVKMDQAVPGLDDDSFYDATHIGRSKMDSFIFGIRHFSENGVLGDPVGSNREAGEKLMEMTIDLFANAISQAIGTP